MFPFQAEYKSARGTRNPRLYITKGLSRHRPVVSMIAHSNNSLTELPESVFGLWSLRYLSAAQNKLECLRMPTDGVPSLTLPVLEELYLQVGCCSCLCSCLSLPASSR